MWSINIGFGSFPSISILESTLPDANLNHYGKDDARVLVWQAPTETMNPRVDKAIIDEAFESDPESAAAEYHAEFRSDLADYITREGIDLVTCWGRHELPPMPGIQYIGFCDPSGGPPTA